MRGPKDVAIAVRKPNKEIILKRNKLNTLGMKYKFFKLPFVRGGVVGLVESMAFGIKALMYSAEFFEEDFEEEEKEGLLDKIFKDKAEDAEILLTLLLSLVLTIGFFILLPSFLTNLFKNKIETSFLLNLLEGGVRILIFLIYITMVSKWRM